MLNDQTKHTTDQINKPNKRNFITISFCKWPFDCWYPHDFLHHMSFHDRNERRKKTTRENNLKKKEKKSKKAEFFRWLTKIPEIERCNNDNSNCNVIRMEHTMHTDAPAGSFHSNRLYKQFGYLPCTD